MLSTSEKATLKEIRRLNVQRRLRGLVTAKVDRRTTYALTSALADVRGVTEREMKVIASLLDKGLKL